eukprot:750142-Hanusia_phi.AAC.2
MKQAKDLVGYVEESRRSGGAGRKQGEGGTYLHCKVLNNLRGVDGLSRHRIPVAVLPAAKSEPQTARSSRGPRA